MVFVSVLGALALVIAAVSLTRLSRAPRALPPAEERDWTSLRAGDVVMTPRGDWLVTGRGPLGEGGAQAVVVELESGRERRFLLVPGEGPLALLDARPASADAEREAALQKGHRFDRATVELLPGA